MQCTHTTHEHILHLNCVCFTDIRNFNFTYQNASLYCSYISIIIIHTHHMSIILIWRTFVCVHSLRCGYFIFFHFRSAIILILQWFRFHCFSVCSFTCFVFHALCAFFLSLYLFVCFIRFFKIHFFSVGPHLAIVQTNNSKHSRQSKRCILKSSIQLSEEEKL